MQFFIADRGMSTVEFRSAKPAIFLRKSVEGGLGAKNQQWVA
jgi:hypothetical protein